MSNYGGFDKTKPRIIGSTHQSKVAYGDAYGASEVTITKDQIQELLEGKTLALTVQQGYSVFIKMGDHATIME